MTGEESVVTGEAVLRLSCVILTMGNRPAQLQRAIASVQAQRGDPVEVVVVVNGGTQPALPADVRVVALPANVGIPAGRNRGVEAATGDVVLFLDDDGWLVGTGAAERLRSAFAREASLGVVSFRITDPDGGPGQRRHVPRLRAGDPDRSSEVTTFLGGACAVRRAVFDRCGGLPEHFHYAHEETDLAWRALDAGFRLRYDADVQMHHPAVIPHRHPEFLRLNARNRVWLARRNLPWPLAAWYLADWVVLTTARERSLPALAVWARGFAEGWRSPSGPRRPMRWVTAARMARLGRPPII